jgi:hypothetical protein
VDSAAQDGPHASTIQAVVGVTKARQFRKSLDLVAIGAWAKNIFYVRNQASTQISVMVGRNDGN